MKQTEKQTEQVKQTPQKLNFMNDYNSVGHPNVLRALADASAAKFPGYGTDAETGRAVAAVRALIQNEAADVHFLMGGTQTNLTAIAAFLRPHEAVIAPANAHINVHETGAIEAVGHKILTVASNDGKLRADDIRAVCARHGGDEHMVAPRLVFLSQSSELGTLYSMAELREIRAVCDALGLYLYVDGARLAVALTSPRNDVSLPALAALADAFYLGGTKNGLLLGEALVIANPKLTADFRYLIKQKGGLLAKGFLLGLQFCALLENGLYFELGIHANDMALRLREGLVKRGFTFFVDSPTNQIFPILPERAAEALAANVLYEVWEREPNVTGGGKGKTAIRLVTSWNTDAAEIEAFFERLDRAMRQ
ncbi:MAG: aminotransferase class I/II-fold pyridoxal phosphate-dependent enzyme [Clostridiales bacterium]|nr:aminotransferase class I/II-fold pyridoxal phosphate-dependent enzyme [Clostridiales bacterium]